MANKRRDVYKANPMTEGKKAVNQRLSSIIATEQITFKELSVADIF